MDAFEALLTDAIVKATACSCVPETRWLPLDGRRRSLDSTLLQPRSSEPGWREHVHPHPASAGGLDTTQTTLRTHHMFPLSLDSSALIASRGAVLIVRHFSVRRRSSL